MGRIIKLMQSLTEDKAWFGRFSPLISLSAFYLGLSLMSRFALWSLFSKEGGVSFLHLPAILTLGLLNDLVVLVYASFPATLYLSLLPTKWFNSSANRRLLIFAVFAAVFGMLYLCAVEYFFFDEFNSRFNLVAVDYLIYPTAVLVDIRESYPVIWYLLATLIVTGLIVKEIWPKINRDLNGSQAMSQRAKLIGIHLVLLLAVYAGVSADTLALSSNRVANELSANGISSFFRAFRTNEIRYDAHYLMIDSARAFSGMRDHLKDSGGTELSPLME